MTSLVDKWCKDLCNLAALAQTQPHAAYSVFTKGLSSKWKYHIRSTECPPEAFGALDDFINTSLLPALTGREFVNDQPERTLLSLPARVGGLAIPVVRNISSDEHLVSKRITQSLVDLIVPTTSTIGTDQGI